MSDINDLARSLTLPTQAQDTLVFNRYTQEYKYDTYHDIVVKEGKVVLNACLTL